MQQRNFPDNSSHLSKRERWLMILTSIVITIAIAYFSNQKPPEGRGGLEFSNRDSISKIPFLKPPSTTQYKDHQKILKIERDIEDDFPPAGHQKEHGSCVAFTISYALVSYYEKSRAGYSYNNAFGFIDYTRVYSPSFVHNSLVRKNSNSDCKTGISFISAFDFIKHNGVCTWSELPYFGGKECGPIPISSHYDKAKKLTGYRFFRVKRDLNTFKDFLALTYPLIVGIYTSKNMYQEGINADKSVSYFWRPSHNDKKEYHSILCVKYDEEKDAFLLLNSWGTDWGNNGYCYIPSEIFMKRVREVYVATLERSPSTNDHQKFDSENKNSPLTDLKINKSFLSQIATQKDNNELDSLLKTDLLELQSNNQKNNDQVHLMKAIEEYLYR